MQRRSTGACIAAVLFVLGMALSQGPVLLQGSQGPPWPPDEDPELTAALRQIDADPALAGRDPASRRTKALVVAGAVNFFRPFPGGNGRSCSTCHDPRDGFSLSPATVEARWQRLQRARRFNPTRPIRCSGRSTRMTARTTSPS